MEICTIPTQDGMPVGDVNPCRYMDEEEHEALLLDSLARILRNTKETLAGKPDFPSQ
jgi:hypothetical protein